MEEYEESLRQKQAAWHKDVADQVLANHDEITVKRWILVEATPCYIFISCLCILMSG